MSFNSLTLNNTIRYNNNQIYINQIKRERAENNKHFIDL